MKLEPNLTDEAILGELGRRLAHHRVALGLTQKEVAQQAGIGSATLERMEAGRSSAVSSMLRVLRVLGLLEGLEQLVPPPTPSPMELLEARGAQRKRASSKRRRLQHGAGDGDGDVAGPGGAHPSWTWGDER